MTSRLSACCFGDRPPRLQQHRPGIDLRAFKQTVERDVRERHHIGRLRQLERQPAQVRRRASDLRQRNVNILFFRRLQKPALTAPMRDRRRLVRFEHALVIAAAPS